MIIIGTFSILVNPDSFEKCLVKSKYFGKVNGEEITRDEFNDQLSLLQQQSQGQPQQGLEEQGLANFGAV